MSEVTHVVAVRGFTAAYDHVTETWREIGERAPIVAIASNGRAMRMTQAETPTHVRRGDHYPSASGLVAAFPREFEPVTVDRDGLPLEAA